MPASVLRARHFFDSLGGPLERSTTSRPLRPIPFHPGLQPLQATGMQKYDFASWFELAAPEELVEFEERLGSVNRIQLYARVAFEIEHRLKDVRLSTGETFELSREKKDFFESTR